MLREPQLSGHAVLHPASQIGIVGRPGSGVGGKLRRRNIERALCQAPLAQRVREPRRVLALELVDQSLVRRQGDVVHAQASPGERHAHKAREHHRGGADRVVPVHVAVHLVFREQQRLERREPLVVQRQRRGAVGAGDDRQRGEQTVNVDHAVWHAAHLCVARQVVELVDVKRARYESCEGSPRLAPPLDQRQQGIGGGAQPFQLLRELPCLEVARGQLLVVREAGLLERVREGIVADVVEQRGQLEPAQVGGGDGSAPRHLFELGERAAREMIRAQGVLEARVRRAGIDQERVPQLAHVAEALNRGRIHHGERLGLEPDVVPEWIANDLELTHAGPASRTAGGTRGANCSKLRRNSSATRAAWTS